VFKKVKQGNALADLAHEMWHFCWERLIPFWVENHHTSFMAFERVGTFCLTCQLCSLPSCFLQIWYQMAQEHQIWHQHKVAGR
jgi:hypothetical protein